MLLCDVTIPKFQNEKSVFMLDNNILIMTNFNICFLKILEKMKINENQAHSSGGNQVDGLPPVCHTDPVVVDDKIG